MNCFSKIPHEGWESGRRSYVGCPGYKIIVVVIVVAFCRVSVRVGVCLSVCLSVLFVVVWASGRAAGSGLSRLLTR